MTIFRAIAAIILMLLSAYLVVMNWVCVIATSRNHRRGIDKHHSTVPMISLLLAAIAVLVYPYAPRYWIWFIPAADLGSWMLLIGVPWLAFRAIFKREPPKEPR